MNPDINLSDTPKLRVLSEYADEKKEKMSNLLESHKDIDFFGQMLDSKVPEKDEAWYHCFTLKISDKDAILNEIRFYQNFFEEICGFVHEVTCGNPVNSENLRRKIARLQNKLSDVYVTAKTEKPKTSSSAIYKLHKSFISEYEKLDYILKDFENVALCEMLTEAQNGWRRALDEIDVLKEQLGDISEKYSDICKKFDALKIEQEKSSAKQNDLIAQNHQLEKKLDHIMETLKRQDPK